MDADRSFVQLLLNDLSASMCYPLPRVPQRRSNNYNGATFSKRDIHLIFLDILWLCKPKTNHGNQDLIVEQNEGKPEASTHDSMRFPASEGLIIFCTTDGKPASILSCCSGPQNQGLPICGVLMLCLDGRGGEVCKGVYG